MKCRYYWSLTLFEGYRNRISSTSNFCSKICSISYAHIKVNYSNQMEYQEFKVIKMADQISFNIMSTVKKKLFFADCGLFKCLLSFLYVMRLSKKLNWTILQEPVLKITKQYWVYIYRIISYKLYEIIVWIIRYDIIEIEALANCKGKRFHIIRFDSWIFRLKIWAQDQFYLCTDNKYKIRFSAISKANLEFN